jgi:hypothetical protein
LPCASFLNGAWFLPLSARICAPLVVKVAHCQAKHQITRALLLLYFPNSREAERCLYIFSLKHLVLAAGAACERVFYSIRFFLLIIYSGGGWRECARSSYHFISRCPFHTSIY